MGKGCPGPAIYAVSQFQRNQEAGLGRQQTPGLEDLLSWEPGRAIYAPKYFAMIGSSPPYENSGLTLSKVKQRGYKPEIIDAEIVEEPTVGETARWGEVWGGPPVRIKKAPSHTCQNCGAVEKEMRNSRLICAYCGG